ncbi:ABC transporter ATP-binding protein [Metabacillus indicus]|uniref:Multidrug ABC transporter n=1 Tax=Metabacillus indicus TaxID=246786 RepID=A0A084H4G0_METID|nr:ABC transporter ATP-binding protein [Metabacillus indicus]KEZ50316.1 multidrug ABC transporter [Metabacillus indicus LMG 22858]KEZ54472.1 multidrug ABC transporter [Metabacillus indicus]
MIYLTHFLRQLNKNAGKSLYVCFVGMIMISILDSLGIILIIPLFIATGLFDKIDNQIVPLSNFFNFIKSLPLEHSIIILLALYILIISLQNIFQRHQTLLSARIQQGFLRHLKEETYKGLLNTNWRFLLSYRKSDILNIMTSEISKVSGGTHFFIQFMASSLFTFVQVIIAFLISPQLTFLVVFFGLILSFFSKKLIKESKNLGSDTFELSKKYFAGVSDQINGIKDIKSNNLEGVHYIWLESISRKMERNINELAKVRANSQLIYKVSSAVLIALFMYFSITIFFSKTAELMLILLIFSRLWPKFTGIQSNLEQIAATIPSFKALMLFQGKCKNEIEVISLNERVDKRLFLKDGIRCSDVSFKYKNDSSNYALKNINLFIPTNKMTAIVGRSGAGKSTLIDILMGLMTPQEGEVTIDGEPLNESNLINFRQTISYVPQDPFLFNTTIRENLLLISQDAKDDQMWEALEFSSAAEFVKKLPNGLDTVIGDRGIRLSGGERQRLVLARAILKKPSILVLDEATSALDTVNEAKIQESLMRLKGKMTIIVIAHRMSTIKNADQVVVLENGQLIQNGGFKQLSQEGKGMFHQLLGNQIKVHS